MSDATTPPKPQKRVHIAAWLRTRFFAGVAVAAPIGLTIFVVWWFVTTIDQLVWSAMRPLFGPDQTWNHIPGVGLVIAAIALIVLGAVAANIAVRAVLQIGERIVAKMPLVRNIYNGIKQVFETVLSGRHIKSREICLVQYPREGIWSIGFVTGDARGEAARAAGEGYVSVYIPHSPNPWTGWLIFVKREEIRPLQLASDDAAKMLLSLGLYQPDAMGRDPLMKDPELGVYTEPAP